MNKLKDIAVLSSLFGGILIFLGVWKLDLYYSHFDISILDYLDFSEIITSFLDDMWFVIIFLLLMTLYTLVGANVITFLINAGRERKTNIEAISRNYLSGKNSVVQLIVSVFAAIAFWLIFEYLNVKVMILISSLFLYQPILILINYLSKRNNELSADKLRNASFIILLLIVVWNKSNYEIRSTVNNTGLLVNLKLKDTNYVSSNKNYYLGKTAKYVFWFQRDSAKSIIIPIERVEQINFTKK